jgi:hypothetical protein
MEPSSKSIAPLSLLNCDLILSEEEAFIDDNSDSED